MFPVINIFWIQIYSFWLTLTVCFFLFLWMLKKISKKEGTDFSFFTKNILWYFLSVFIFSRLFYVISNWNDLKYIRNPFDFFIMSDYNFSLAGAIFWFLFIFYLHLRSNRLRLKDYIDPVVLSFLFIVFIAYIWALFGWQVYWRDTSFWIEILYTNSFSPVPYQVPIFPLPIVYSILNFILFSVLYILSMFIKIRWFVWYIWILVFSSFILIFEFFSWKYDDTLKNIFGINIIQFLSIFLIIIFWYQLFRLLKSSDDNKILKNDLLK